MHRRRRLVHFILAIVVALSLTPPVVVVDAEAQIAFSSDRDGDNDIYVMDPDGGNLRRLTNNLHDDSAPAWFVPTLAVSPVGKKFTMWGWLKQADR